MKKTQEKGEAAEPEVQKPDRVALIDEIDVFLHPGRLSKLPALMAGLQIPRTGPGKDNLDTLQGRILRFSTGDDDSHPLWQRHQRAIDRSVHILGEIILGAKGARYANQVGSKDYFDAIAWRYAEIDPVSAMTCPLFRETLISRMDSQDVSFFTTIGGNFSKSRSRKGIPNFNPIALKMAEYWTHPDAPLWMMNNQAGSTYVAHLLKKNVSAENFSQIIKRYRLVRFGRFPIADVRISKNHEFLGFTLSHWMNLKV